MNVFDKLCPDGVEREQCLLRLCKDAAEDALRIARRWGCDIAIAQDVGQEAGMRVLECHERYKFCQRPPSETEALIYTIVKHVFGEELDKISDGKHLVFPKCIAEKYAQEKIHAERLIEEAKKDVFEMFCSVIQEHDEQIPVALPIDLSTIEDDQRNSIVLKGSFYLLKTEQFRVFALRIGGLTHKDIAALLGITVGCSRSRLWAARVKLREAREKLDERIQ
jgi:DNA-directed RNA polymerase specialized sigma24 family protein